MCFTVDHRLLFVDLTEEAIEDGFLFYATFYEAPPAIKVCDMIFCVLYNDVIPPFFAPLRRAESEGRCCSSYATLTFVCFSFPLPCNGTPRVSGIVTTLFVERHMQTTQKRERTH